MREEPSLVDVLSALWKAKIFLLIGALAGILLALAALFFLTPHYKAAMIVAPADGYALGDYAGVVSEGRSLDIPFWRPKDQEGVSTDFYRFIYMIKGPSAASILLKDKSVLAGLSRDPRWEAGQVSAESLAIYLDRYVRIEHLGTTPLRRITYRHPDGQFAAAFLRKIHLVADQLIRRDRRTHSENRIKYLEQSLSRTLNPDHRNGIAGLLMQQEHIRMLANLDEQYAAIVVEPPFSSPRPDWPDRTLVLVCFASIGALCGFIFHAARRRDR